MENYTELSLSIGTFIRKDHYKIERGIQWVKDHNGRMVTDGEFEYITGDAVNRLVFFENTGLTQAKLLLLLKKTPPSEPRMSAWARSWRWRWN